MDFIIHIPFLWTWSSFMHILIWLDNWVKGGNWTIKYSKLPYTASHKQNSVSKALLNIYNGVAKTAVFSRYFHKKIFIIDVWQSPRHASTLARLQGVSCGTLTGYHWHSSSASKPLRYAPLEKQQIIQIKANHMTKRTFT